MDLDDLLEEFKDEKNPKVTTVNAPTRHQQVNRAVSDWDDDLPSGVTAPPTKTAIHQ